MRRLLVTLFAALLLPGVLTTQEPVPAPPPVPVPPVGPPPSLPVTLPDPSKKTPPPTAPEKVAESPDVYFPQDVDAVPVLDSVQAWYYPKGKLGRNAKVVFLAIVDTFGRIEPSSIRLVSATDTSFIIAARLTLMVAYYHPAQKDGRPVQMLVKQGLKYDRNTPHACEMNPMTPMLPPKCSPHR